MAKITLSVPDDLYQKLERYKDRLNYSDIFRRAVQKELEKLERKGELIEGLLSYLGQRLTNVEEDRERIRREEIERFSKKWGTPDHITKTEEAPLYVTLLKNIKIEVGEKTIAELQVSNSRSLARRVIEDAQRAYGIYDLELYDESLKPIVEYFKSKDFTIAERHLLQADVMRYVLKKYGSEGRERWRQLVHAGYNWFGLFASNGEDYVFIGYREVKRS